LSAAAYLISFATEESGRGVSKTSELAAMTLHERIRDLEDEIADLRAEISRLNSGNKALENQNTELEKENRRLRGLLRSGFAGVPD
jgi:TolA-binding protein